MENMSVDHGGANILVAEEFLNGADVISALEEVGGEGMTKSMTGDALFDGNFLGGLLDSSLKARGFEVMAADTLIPTFLHFKCALTPSPSPGGRGEQ